MATTRRGKLVLTEPLSAALAYVFAAVACVGGFASAIAGRVEKAAPQALFGQGDTAAEMVNEGGFWIGLGGLAATVLVKLWPYFNRVMDDRANARNFEGQLKSATERIDQNEQKINVLSFALGHYREALRTNRRWMREMAAKHGEPLPDGFEDRIFDRVTDLDDLLDYMQPHALPTPAELTPPAPSRGSSDEIRAEDHRP